MSKTQTPITTVFDLQRTALVQSQKAFQQTLDLQLQASEILVEGLESGDAARERGVDVAEAAVEAYFDALEASVPGDAEGVAELRASALEGIETGAEIQAETWEAVREIVEENVAAYGEFAATYADLVDDSFEAALQAHEYAEEQTVSAAETVEGIEAGADE